MADAEIRDVLDSAGLALARARGLLDEVQARIDRALIAMHGKEPDPEPTRYYKLDAIVYRTKDGAEHYWTAGGWDLVGQPWPRDAWLVSRARELTEDEALDLTERAAQPEPEPEPPAPPREPARLPSPWSSGHSDHTEYAGPIRIDVIANRERNGVLYVPRTTGSMKSIGPRESAAVLTGNVWEWARQQASRIGWRGALELPQETRERVIAWANDDVHRWKTEPFLRPWWHTNAAWGGGGWGVQRWSADWQHAADPVSALVSRALELVGIINHCPMVADWPTVAPQPYHLLRGDSSPLKGYPGQSKALVPDGAHLSRITLGPLWLYEHTKLETARWWIREVWQDACRAFGAGVEWDVREEVNGFAWTQPWARRIQVMLERGYAYPGGGRAWLNRDWYHVLRLALEMERLGIDCPGAPMSPAQAVERFREAFKLAHQKSPWAEKRDARRFVLQFDDARTSADGDGGYPVEKLRDEDKALGRWCLPGENAFLVELYRDLGMHEAAEGLAALIGKHPAWAMLLDEENAPRIQPVHGWRFGGFTALGEPQSLGMWYDPNNAVASQRVPSIWMHTHPEAVTREDVLAAAASFGSNRECGLDYVPRPVRVREVGL